jgi:hypothetical protein
MKTKTLLGLSVVLFGTALAASAGTSWSVTIGGGAPVYYPPPVVVAPPFCPPPRVVCPPPVVYYPQPVCPPPRYYAPPAYAWNHPRHGKGGYCHDRYCNHRGHQHGYNHRGHGRH